MEKAQIGVIGMGVMGANLARNFASKGVKTAIFNRTYQRTIDLLAAHPDSGLDGYEKLEEFVAALEKPRRMIVMVQAGAPVDEVIANLRPLLEKGDVIIDGGNSFFQDTVRRAKDLESTGLNFVGMGISGGEEGALHGPSMMPGGSEEAWTSLKPILEKIAARDFDGGACVTHIGQDGAGHYVKMVHNGIEYAMMQLIAEIYDYCRKIEGLDSGKIAEIFEKIQQGPAQSFLAEITIPVLKHKDNETGDFLINKVLDKAAQKGTGGWTAMEGFKTGTPISAISEAVFARSLSSFKDARVKLSKVYGDIDVKKTEAVNFEKVMEFGMLIAYGQGLDLVLQAAREYKWTIDLAEVCRIWQGGCIIRAEMLKMLKEVISKKSGLMTDEMVVARIKECVPEFRKFIGAGVMNEVALPVGASMIAYFDGMKAAESPANLIQGLRDFFGAHTFERNDKSGVFHEEWN